MKGMSRKTFLVVAVFAVLCIGLAGSLWATSGKTYKAKFYVAGMGGHFADVDCEIDPSAAKPINVTGLSKVDIGDKDSHPVHDARIDSEDRGVMFWSTYKVDKKTNMTHVGKTNLKTGEVLLDVGATVPEEATNTKSMYCASAQSKEHFLPISMANKGYIDVFTKSDLKMVRRVFLEGTDADIQKPYKFYHGTNSPDMKKLLITINESDTPQGNTIGKLHLIMVDMDAFINGEVKVLAKTVLPGAEKKTVSFRQYFSNDGRLIANATGDRLFIVKADTLELVDAEMLKAVEETHDAIFTPDDKYVVITSRTKRPDDDCETPESPKDGEYIMDGHLKLYDVEAKKMIGESSSVCLACHDQMGLDAHAVLCGLDANWQ